MKGGTRKRGKTWSYYFDAAPIGGKRKKIEKGGFRTKKEAEAALAKALVEYTTCGQLFQPSELSVSDYLDFWYQTDCEPNFSEHTLRNYKTRLNTHLKPRFGQYPLKALQASTIQTYLNDLKKQGYSKATITGILFTLSTALAYAVEPLHYIRENPCRYVKIGTITRPAKERIVLTDASFQQILGRFPPGSRFHLPLLLGWHCGLRIGECMALTWEAIDLEARTLVVEQQLVRRSKADETNETRETFWALREPKYHSVRKIKFGETLYESLKAEKKRQTENELLYGEAYTVYYLTEFTDEQGTPRKRIVETTKGAIGEHSRFPLLCVHKNGKMTTAETFQYCSRLIHNELQLSFDYHSLRHTHATRLLEAGANIKAIQQRLGHKNITTTMNTYVHDTDELAQQAVALLDLLEEKHSVSR